jgi:hypothetical protein
MKKILTNKWLIAAVVVIIGYLFFAPKADAATFDAEIGKYEKRIDSGAYSGAEDSLYYKLSTDIPVFKSLGLVGDLEYVDSDVSELYVAIGTTLSTPIGDVGAGVELSQVDGEADVYELIGSYDLTLFDAFTTTIDAAINEDRQGNIDASFGQLIYSNGSFDLIGGGAIGGSFGTDDDYTYTLGFARLQIDALYAQYNYLKNDIVGAGGTDDSWQGTMDVGLAFTF